MTDLVYSAVEDEVRATVRQVLADRSPVSQVLARIEGGAAFDQDLWRVLTAEMGLAGMAVPERLGGGGASLREAAVVLEELGRGVAPAPYLSSAVVATEALLTSDEADLVAKLAAGQAIAVLAVPFATAPGSFTPTVSVVDGALHGDVRGMADGLAADVLLVPTDAGLFAVDATAEGVVRSPVTSLDLTRPLADHALSGAHGKHVSSAGSVDRSLTVGAALLASEQVGLAEWCLQTTVEYLKTRHQFGRAVGSYQALKHRLADVWVELSQARAVARYAAVCAAEDDPDLPVAASLAQAFCSPMAVKAAEECVQLHGGIGFTWEHPAHLYLKRAKSAALAYGTADRHRQILATLVDLPS
jgi:alkylation response protein AidB-like acyl-CoA dehydrogenase